MRRIDIAGKRFGRLVVLREGPKHTNGKLRWYCDCDCGQVSLVLGNLLRTGVTSSCGCYRNDAKKHGHCGVTWQSPTYKSYRMMLNRCNNPRATGFENYGGRGILVCSRWSNSFENFLADMGVRPVGTTLERKNNDAGYSKRNCKWATPKEQASNRRPKSGEVVVHV